MQHSETGGLTSPPESNPKRRRKPLNCEPCRHSKLRCDRELPCTTCLRRGWQDQCTYEPGPRAETLRSPRRRRTRNRQSVVRDIVSQPEDAVITPTEPSSGPHDHSTGPRETGQREPSPEGINRRWDEILRRPAIVERTNTQSCSADTAPTMICFGPNMQTTELLRMLPPDTVCEYLVCWYFTHLCPLFRVLHGPTFQKQYSAFLKDPQGVDLSWLALLFAICSLTVKAIPPNDTGLLELWQNEPLSHDLCALSQNYRTAAMMSLSQDQFLIRHNLNTLEALLVVIQAISDTEGAEHVWALLGVAHNIAIALRCHTDPAEPNCIKRERRRRCWASTMILHTDQALLFRDTDLTFLCEMKAALPVDANDVDITEDAVTAQTDNAAAPKPTDMSLLRFQSRLFHLATDVCNAISKPNLGFDDELMSRLDLKVAQEQEKWDKLYLIDGVRSVLDTAGYAQWLILQTYAHQLYLLLHRPYHSSRSSRFRPTSRDKCITSALALMDIHRQLDELPRLRPYRWMTKGSIACNALHGAVALTSCILDMPQDANISTHISAINATTSRIEKLRNNSPACANVYIILRHLQ